MTRVPEKRCQNEYGEGNSRRSFPKLLAIINKKMKSRLTKYKYGLLLLLGFLLVNPLKGQTGDEQLATPITLEIRELPLEKVLEKLERKAKVRFSYSRDLIPHDRSISGSYQNTPLREVLQEILDGTGIEYKVIGSQILLFPSHSKRKEKTLLNGYVRDKGSGEALIGAAVYDLISGIGTYTNNYGFYSLDLPPDSLEIMVSYIGYDRIKASMAGGNRKRINWDLTPAKMEMGEVKITDEELDRPEKLTQMSQFNIPVVELKKLPALMGEVDVIRNLQLLPGVQSGNEGTTGLYVRGGGPDQNLILIDDVPVYNASHLFGFFSVFNSDAIRSVGLTKGGFPARYGGRLSSVVDIRMKEGNMNEYGLDASIGLISSKITVEGPIQKGKSSFMVAGRRTYLDALTTPLQKIINRQNDEVGPVVGYRFWDLNAKINHKFSDNDRLYLSVYSGKDRENHFTQFRNTDDPENNYVEQRGGFAWQNLISSLRWNHLFSDRIFVNTSLIYSDYEFSLGDEVEYVSPDPSEEGISTSSYFSRIQDIGIKTDFDYRPGKNHTLRWGGALTRHHFRPGANRSVRTGFFGSDNSSFEAPLIPALEGYLYLEDEIQFHPKVSANLGLHASAFQVRGRTYRSLQPRVAARYQVAPKTALKASFVTMSQNLHLLTNTGIGLPTDLWVPPTDRILPQQSWQVAVGAGGSFGGQYAWSVEAYMKKMDNVIAYKDASFLIDADENWEDNVVAGKGTSEGIEFFLHKKKGQLTGWVGYTLSNTQRQFEEFNDGRPFPYKFDRRHDASIALNYDVNERIKLSANWIFGTGQAATVPIALTGFSYNEFGVSEPWQVIYGDRNNVRMRPQHRLDLGASFYKKKKWGERWWTIGIYNAYSRLNPFFIGARSIRGPEPGYELYEFSLFPIIPSFSYRIKI